MKKSIGTALLSLAALISVSCGGASDNGSNSSVSSRTESATPTELALNPAMNAPDETAWRLFAQVMRPADGGVATFEPWASDGETFRPNATWPTDGGGIQPRTARPTLALFAAHRVGARRLSATGELAPGARPADLGDAATEDVRRNRPAFDFIVSNRLNSISGLRQAYANSLELVFPADSIEVKTNWLRLDQLAAYYPAEVAANPSRYFYISRDSTGRQHALLSIHIISKQVPNWTWATFEHQATPGRCDIIGCHDAFGATVPNVAPGATPNGAYAACVQTPALQAIFSQAGLGAVLANYCLKGSQTDFTDATGLAVRLGNSITESGFVDQSSCMTCHATAGFTSTGAHTPFGLPIGPVPASIFWTGGGTPPYQNGPGLARIARPADFVWSIPFCAFDDVTNPGHPAASRCAAK